MIECIDSLEYLKTKQDYEFDINYSDPPYALGSEIIIRADGKVDYKKANDFMNKWEMPTGAYWEQWFKEAYRTLKYGGYLVMFGMDRQLLLFKYYANLAGFTEQQSLYWYFISNFPKATDLSKQIDKNAGAERNIIGTRNDGAGNIKGFTSADDRTESGSGFFKEEGTEIDITTPSTELAKKYEGYKYSISPLKQTNETIMVFQKPYKTGSCLHDTLAYENGDETCCCGAFDIDGNRVDFQSEEDKKESTQKNQHKDFGTEPMTNNNCYGDFSMIEPKNYNPTGRYPSQTFCDSNTAEILGEPSKILHKCDLTLEELEGFSISELARIFNLDRKTVREKLKELGIYKKPTKYVKNNDTERTCECCKILKPIEEFAKWRAGNDYGYRHICKICSNKKSAPQTEEALERSRAIKLAHYHNVRKLDNGKISAEDIQKIKSVGECYYCGTTDAKFHLDHIVPVVKGGKTEMINMVLACERCNTSKGARSVDEWYKEQDFFNDEKLNNLYFYNPKVSKSERNAGCDDMEESFSAASEFRPNHMEKTLNGENGNPYGRWTPLKNNHPTLKPIKLNERILKLFKTPNEQNIIYPFAGSGSEVIGGIKAGFNNYCGCELSQDYIDIANARIEYWVNKFKEDNAQGSIFDFIGDD